MKEAAADPSASVERTGETSEGVSRLTAERLLPSGTHPGMRTDVHSGIFAGSKTAEARDLVREFVSTLELEEGDESIDGIENLPRFMERIASAASDPSIPLPVIFEGGHGRVGFMWYREQGDCYLYTKLDSMEAKWVESEHGEHIRTQMLDMSYWYTDWNVLERNLQAAYAE